MAKINAKVIALFKGEAEVTAEAVQAILDELQADSAESIEKLKADLAESTETIEKLKADLAESTETIEKLKADLAELRQDPSKANQCLETATVDKQAYRFKKGIAKFKVPTRILPVGFKPEGMDSNGEITAENAIQCKELMAALVKVGAGIIEEA